MNRKTNHYYSLLPDEYSLLKPTYDNSDDEINNIPDTIDDYIGAYMVRPYSFNGKPVSANPEAVELVNKTLAFPFIVNAKFKSYKGTSSCLFSIKQADVIILQLCITTVGVNKSRISLTSSLFSPLQPVEFMLSENFINKWKQITWHVKENEADIYIDCFKQYPSKVLKAASEVFLTDKMKIALAFSPSRIHKFEVSLNCFLCSL